MNQRELMYGNFVHIISRRGEVHLPSPDIFKILTFGFDVEVIPYNKVPAQVEKWIKIKARDISPISITKEILKDLFLFIEEDDNWLEILVGTTRYRVKLSENVTNCWRFCIDDHFITNNLEYIHQLQNLYFILTNKELQWK